MNGLALAGLAEEASLAGLGMAEMAEGARLAVGLAGLGAAEWAGSGVGERAGLVVGCT